MRVGGVERDGDEFRTSWGRDVCLELGDLDWCVLTGHGEFRGNVHCQDLLKGYCHGSARKVEHLRGDVVPAALGGDPHDASGGKTRIGVRQRVDSDRQRAQGLSRIRGVTVHTPRRSVLIEALTAFNDTGGELSADAPEVHPLGWADAVADRRIWWARRGKARSAQNAVHVGEHDAGDFEAPPRGVWPGGARCPQLRPEMPGPSGPRSFSPSFRSGS